MSYRDFFSGKKITLIGLGLLGRGLGDAVFLAECGAELTITDLRDAKTLAPSLAKLKKFKKIHYTLGQHKLTDFRNRDFILKAAGVHLDSPYIAEARKHNVPIEMDASLFAKLMPKEVTLVGVTGTRGKSTTTALIYDILNSSFPKGGAESARRRIFRGGNLVPEATLPLLKKVKAGDIVVLELDSWQLQGFHDAKISPQIAVFTTFLDDHLVYYQGNQKRYFEDKVAIFKYQKAGDLLIAGEQVAKLISARFDLKSGKRSNLKSRSVIIARSADVPKDWKPKLLGEHNRENIACAIAVAKHFEIPDSTIRKAVEHFKSIPGRLQYLRTVRLPATRGVAQAGGVKIYNDNNATTPDATIAALRALSTKSQAPNSKQNSKYQNIKISQSQNIILICGGTDKVLGRHDKLVDEISKRCKAAILLKEAGTEKLKSKLEALESKTLQIKEMDGLPACVKEAMKIAKKGDIVLFSPAFASFGKWFTNEYDRGEQFVELIKSL